MAKWRPRALSRARLEPGEIHLRSFQGEFCEWTQGWFQKKETPSYINGADFVGHITNTRLIIEPETPDPWTAIIGDFAPVLEKIVPVAGGIASLLKMQGRGGEIVKRLADEVGYLSFNFASMDHLAVWDSAPGCCWPVMSYNLKGRNPVFMPQNDEFMEVGTIRTFAEVIKAQGVRIVIHTSAATLP